MPTSKHSGAPTPSIRQRGRALTVAGLAARVGASYGKSLLSRALGLSDEEAASLTHEKNAARILETAITLRGPFMKIVQLMAMQNEALPEEYLDALSTVHDKAPPLPWRSIKPVLRAEFGREVEEVFASIDPNPIAAASLGQVYSAQLRDGTPVAVKVQYPGVREGMEADLATMRRVLKTQKLVGANVLRIQTLNYDDLLADVTDRLREELDYKHEARNIEIFRRVYRDWEWMTVPRVYPEFSTERVLTMDLLSGDPMGPLLRNPDLSMEKRETIARRIWRMLVWELWGVGVVHADPHPGNRLIGPQGEIRLLDYGCIKVLPRNWTDGGRKLVRAMVTNDDALLLEALHELDFIPKGLDPKPMIEYQKFANRPLLIDAPFRPGDHDYNLEARAQFLKLASHGYLGFPAQGAFIFRVGIGFTAIMRMLGVNTLNQHRMAIEFLEQDLGAADQTRADLEGAGLI